MPLRTNWRARLLSARHDTRVLRQIKPISPFALATRNGREPVAGTPNSEILPGCHCHRHRVTHQFPNSARPPRQVRNDRREHHAPPATAGSAGRSGPGCNGIRCRTCVGTGRGLRRRRAAGNPGLRRPNQIGGNDQQPARVPVAAQRTEQTTWFSARLSTGQTLGSAQSATLIQPVLSMQLSRASAGSRGRYPDQQLRAPEQLHKADRPVRAGHGTITFGRTTGLGDIQWINYFATNQG